jgi:hypothetical protein
METETAERPFRCDCVKLKRAIQAKIYEETKYMTPEEQREHFRQAGESFRAELDRRRATRATEKQTG